MARGRSASRSTSSPTSRRADCTASSTTAAHSQATKVAGREPVRIHPVDAAARGIADGDVVRVFNDRGACLAGAVVSDDVRPVGRAAVDRRVVRPARTAMCVHGNPNVLTRDRGTSRLAQGSTGQHCLVEIERYDADPPPVRAHQPPRFTTTTARWATSAGR